MQFIQNKLDECKDIALDLGLARPELYSEEVRKCTHTHTHTHTDTHTHTTHIHTNGRDAQTIVLRCEKTAKHILSQAYARKPLPCVPFARPPSTSRVFAG